MAVCYARSLQQTLRTASGRAQNRARTLSTQPPNIHGDLDPEQVKSKAMRKKLQAAQADAQRAKAVVEQPPHQQQPPQYYQPPPPQPEPVSFGRYFLANAFQGFAVALGFIFIFGVLKAVGLEGVPQPTQHKSLPGQAQSLPEARQMQ